MVKVKIPGPLRRLLDGKDEVEIEAKTVKELIDKLCELNPEIKSRILDENGNVRRFINIYINNEDIRFLKGVETELKGGDEVVIIPAIAGGKEGKEEKNKKEGEGEKKMVKKKFILYIQNTL